MSGPSRRPLADRLWAKVTIRGEHECWLWSGATNGKYGRISPGGHTGPGNPPIGAHVAAWMVTHDMPVPKGKLVMHTCDIPLCCNPRHLLLGTTAENNRDASTKGRAHWTRTTRDQAGRFTEEVTV